MSCNFTKQQRFISIKIAQELQNRWRGGAMALMHLLIATSNFLVETVSVGHRKTFTRTVKTSWLSCRSKKFGFRAQNMANILFLYIKNLRYPKLMFKC